MSQQPHILVVEDEAAQREILAYNLQAEGFRVSCAEDGEAGLLALPKIRPMSSCWIG